MSIKNRVFLNNITTPILAYDFSTANHEIQVVTPELFDGLPQFMFEADGTQNYEHAQVTIIDGDDIEITELVGFQGQIIDPTPKLMLGRRGLEGTIELTTLTTEAVLAIRITADTLNQLVDRIRGLSSYFAIYSSSSLSTIRKSTGLLRNNDTWETLSTTNFWIGKIIKAEGRFVATGSNSKIGISFDMKTWRIVNTPLDAVASLAIAHADGIWMIGGFNGTFAISTDMCETWTSVDIGFGTERVFSIAVSGPFGQRTWVAVGGAGKNAYSTDNGQTWTNPDMGSFNIIRTVVAHSSGFIAGDDGGYIYRLPGAGQPWQQIVQYPGVQIRLAVNGNDVIAIGFNMIRFSQGSTVAFGDNKDPLPGNKNYDNLVFGDQGWLITGATVGLLTNDYGESFRVAGVWNNTKPWALFYASADIV
ncbi:MAG: hypothetical protein IBX56_08335 [Methylomicrobium sp.]|nr:hypothetical protein [Methylomicrobium sp.]